MRKKKCSLFNSEKEHCYYFVCVYIYKANFSFPKSHKYQITPLWHNKFIVSHSWIMHNTCQRVLCDSLLAILQINFWPTFLFFCQKFYVTISYIFSLDTTFFPYIYIYIYISVKRNYTIGFWSLLCNWSLKFEASIIDPSSFKTELY